MKTRFLITMASLAIFGLAMQSCDKDDENSTNVPKAVEAGLQKIFPKAGRITWEQKNGYYVADFKQGTTDIDVWFDAEGKWYLTETDIAFADLPQSVKTSFAASKYGSWKVDDVDKLERTNMETVYIIEVEKGKEEFDLYFTETGMLIKAVPDSDNNKHEPAKPIPSAIQTFITNKYPNAKIIDIDVEPTKIEVDIIHDNKAKEIDFDLKGQWIKTSWDLLPANLPAAVKDAVAAQHPGKEIDDAEYAESPEGNYYLIEIENEPNDIIVKIKDPNTQ